MKNIYIITIILLLFSACYSELDLTTDQPNIVVSSFIANDSLIKVNLLKTAAVNELSQKVYITDANIELFEDGKYIEDLAPADSTYKLNGQTYTVHYYVSKTRAKSGKKYSVKINTSFGDQLSAETIIPEPVSILAIDTIFENTINSGENTMDKKETYKIRIQDPVGKNYYRITMRKRYGRNQGDNTVKISERHGALRFFYMDSIFSYFNEDEENEIFKAANNSFLIFNDEKIEGEEYELELYRELTESYYGTSKGDFTQYVIELHSLTKEGYTYLKTVDIQSQLNTIEEPVLSYTNIENGVGIFAGYSASQKVITIGEYPIEGITYK